MEDNMNTEPTLFETMVTAAPGTPERINQIVSYNRWLDSQYKLAGVR